MTVSIQRLSAVSLVLAAALATQGVQAQEKAKALASPAAPQAAIGASPVLLEGKGISITRQDMLADSLRMPPEMRPLVLSRPQNVKQIASNLYVLRTMAKMAQEQGLDRDPKVAAIVQVARDKALADAWLAAFDEKNTPTVEAAEKQARTIYLAHPERFKVGEEVRASHILVAGKDADAKAQAERLLADLKNGADFAALAQERSADKGSGARGGDLGFFGKDRMAPEFEAAAFALQKPGELSGVVQTQFGYHIIRLEERKPARTKTFDEARDELVQGIRASAAQDVRAQVAEQIRKDAQFNDSAVDAFVSENSSKR
ncbi:MULTISPECIES: peptidylprolyl isomerase [unclassified Delftia]|uniref:peptidylprolyl isomerase n=1 Tax=unclassified Delftia TaxID=2613839 RepID=UPI00114DCD30|nr:MULTISPECIES: peptidylprolyl isomerase [unclassified Delftia]MCB4789420.1 peptidylprolyl isomerase [Delftia sp. Lp-1]TQL83731.1 peptidyl-prolyl cis-trans isomerase C [Delftia sp. HK171]